ncbi:MAG: 50S ribosomal protein L15 [Planctomycetes bacterium]|nr:50S ribosomal protein L15 [Planctomycetota bacterium]
MMLHEIMNAGPKRVQRTRVGRGMGSGLGESCGRGQSGAYSRSGNSMKLGFEGGTMRFFRRLPRRGFNNKAFRLEWATLNLVLIERAYQAGEEVTVESAIERGVVRRNSKRIKVLGDGEISKAIKLGPDVAASGIARAKIEKAGGTVVMPPPKKLPPNFRRMEADKKRAAKVAAATPTPAAAKGAKADKASKAEKPAKADKTEGKKADGNKKDGGKKPAGGDKKK